MNLFAADKPIRHVEDDEYGREKYVDNLAYALLTGDDSDGLVVGIEGDSPDPPRMTFQIPQEHAH